MRPGGIIGSGRDNARQQHSSNQVERLISALTAGSYPLVQSSSDGAAWQTDCYIRDALTAPS